MLLVPVPVSAVLRAVVLYRISIGKTRGGWTDKVTVNEVMSKKDVWETVGPFCPDYFSRVCLVTHSSGGGTITLAS